MFEVAVSVDTTGILEYWSGAKQDYKFPKCAKFESKLDTDLFEFVKHKAQLFGLGFSPDGTKFATISSDHKVTTLIRLFIRRWSLLRSHSHKQKIFCHP